MKKRWGGCCAVIQSGTLCLNWSVADGGFYCGIHLRQLVNCELEEMGQGFRCELCAAIYPPNGEDVEAYEERTKCPTKNETAKRNLVKAKEIIKRHVNFARDYPELRR